MSDSVAEMAGAQLPAAIAAAPRLTVEVDTAGEARQAWRVAETDQVLRMRVLISAAESELRQVNLPPGASARLECQLDAITAELERSLSPALAGELRRLVGHARGGSQATPRNLQVQYACLAGWIDGLIIGVLGQLEIAAAQARG